MLSARPSIAKELFTPTEGRLARTIQITLVAMIVVTISMTFRIPDPALSAYIVFFVAKEDSGRSILISVVFIFAIALVVGLTFLLVPISLNHPSLRILFIAAASFVMFFLGRTSKLAPLASTLGLIMAYALDLEQKAPIGEIATRALLYVLLFATFPILVLIVFNVFFGRHPERLLRAALAARLNVCADVLRGNRTSEIDALIVGGNVELATELKIIRLLHRLPADTSARLKALIATSYGQLLTVSALRSEAMACPVGTDVPERLDRLARTIEDLPAVIEPSPRGAVGSPPAATLLAQLESLTSVMEGIVAGAPLPDIGSKEPAEPKSGFFKPDAFTGPDGERFALKATAAVMICYLTFNLLDWPGISTCMITCFIVALSTVGESTQKMTLRLAGCTVGAILGYAALVFVLPSTTQITGLLVLVGVITAPAAWLAVGSPRISYIGFQMAFAAYLCVLQGTEPKFDLTIARDRFIGIVFGDLTVFVIFTQVYATSLLPGLSKDLVAILDRCRAILNAIAEAKPTLAIGEQVAGVYALVQKIDNDLVAFGFEKRPTRFGRLHVLSCQLIGRALHDVIADLATIAAYPAPRDDAGVRQSIDQRLASLTAALVNRDAIAVERRSITTGAGPPPSGTDEASRRAKLGALWDDLNRLTATVSRYRRVMRKEAEGAYG